jgi:hypothetical protein
MDWKSTRGECQDKLGGWEWKSRKERGMEIGLEEFQVPQEEEEEEREKGKVAQFAGVAPIPGGQVPSP